MLLYSNNAMSRHFEKNMKYSTGKCFNQSSFHFFLRAYERKGFKKKRLYYNWMIISSGLYTYGVNLRLYNIVIYIL